MVSNHIHNTTKDRIGKQKQLSRRLDLINKDIHFCRVLIVTINLQSIFWGAHSYFIANTSACRVPTFFLKKLI